MKYLARVVAGHRADPPDRAPGFATRSIPRCALGRTGSTPLSPSSPSAAAAPRLQAMDAGGDRVERACGVL